MDLLKKEIGQKVNISGDFNILLDSSTISLPTSEEKEASIFITDLSLTQDQRRFSAKVMSDGHTNKPFEVKLSGKIQFLTDIPVAVRPLGAEDIISEADLTWQKFPTERLSTTLITDVKTIVGNTANNKIIQPGQPIYKTDIKPQTLIKRGAIVVVVYRDQNMQISTRAEAKTDGLKGQSITLTTLDNNKRSIQAIVTGPNQAEVTPAGF